VFKAFKLSKIDFALFCTGGFRIVTVFDYAAIAMILILRLVGIYRRRRLAQQVRHLAAAAIEPELEQREL
jgi:RING finger protein 170